MTFKTLVSDVAADSGVSQPIVRDVLASLARVAVNRAKDGNDSPIPNLGVFAAKHRKERAGSNPQTGAAIAIPAKTVLAFRVSPSVRDL